MPLSSALYTVFLCLIFGANAVAMKISFLGVGPYTAAGIRFLFAGIAIFAWAHFTGKKLRLEKDHAIPILILSVIFTIQLSLFYVGLSQTTASRGTLISNLLPFFIMILAHFIIPDDKINLKKFSGILVGFSGIISLFYSSDDVSGNYFKGDMIILGAVTLWSVNAVYIKFVIKRIEPHIITFYPMVMGAPVFLLMGYLYDDAMVFNLDLRVVFALIYQSFVTAAYGFIAWNRLLEKYGATSLHTFVFIMPIAGVFFSALLLGEEVSGNILISLVLITAGIIFVNLDFRKIRKL